MTRKYKAVCRSSLQARAATLPNSLPTEAYINEDNEKYWKANVIQIENMCNTIVRNKR